MLPHCLFASTLERHALTHVFCSDATANLQRWHSAIFQHVIEAITYIRSINGQQSIDVLGLLGHTLVDVRVNRIIKCDNIPTVDLSGLGRSHPSNERHSCDLGFRQRST